MYCTLSQWSQHHRAWDTVDSETRGRDVGPHANEVKVAILIPALHAHVDVVRYSGHTCVAVVRARFGAQRRRC